MNEGRKLVVRIENDPDTECPSDYDGWKLISFGSRHNNYKESSNYIPPNIGLRRKLQVGLAYWLSYYQHGGCAWSLKGEGMNCPWDSVSLAGVLIWTQKPKDLCKDPEDRAKIARCFLETYNDWANGNCYYYCVDTVDGEHVNSCGGYIGEDHLIEGGLSEALKEGDTITVEGNCAWVLNYHSIPGVTVVDEHDMEEIEEESTLNRIPQL